MAAEPLVHFTWFLNYGSFRVVPQCLDVAQVQLNYGFSKVYPNRTTQIRMRKSAGKRLRQLPRRALCTFSRGSSAVTCEQALTVMARYCLVPQGYQQFRCTTMVSRHTAG